MKKVAITLIVLLISELSFAHALAAGTFKGKGQWSSLSSKGNYQITTAIEHNLIKTHYVLPDGSSNDWNFEIRDINATLFDVIIRGKKIGSGYCLEKVPVCHYELNVGQL